LLRSMPLSWRICDITFSTRRDDVDAVRAPLIELQKGRCFYCDRKVSVGHVDHFIPWDLQHDNRLENLVVACSPCNSSKSDTLASARHAKHWINRLVAPLYVQLSGIAESLAWETGRGSVLAIALNAYQRHGSGLGLWDKPGLLVPMSATELAEVASLMKSIESV
jgi:hypothetical protein